MKILFYLFMIFTSIQLEAKNSQLGKNASNQAHFYLSLELKNYNTCKTILNTYPQTTVEEINFKKLGDVLLKIESTGRIIFQATNNEKTKINQVAASPTQISWTAKSINAALNNTQIELIPLKTNTNPRLHEEDLVKENYVSVYPNPASEYVIINWDYELLNPSLVITDITGKLLLNKQLQSGGLSYEWIVSEIEAGLHIITLIDNNNKVSVSKVMISK